MGSLFLAPHNDDETLFGAFTLIRERPLVVVCLSCDSQERSRPAVTEKVRAKETVAALAALGLPDYFAQWPFSEIEPDWAGVQRSMAQMADQSRYEHVYAPFPHPDGHEHHTKVGLLAKDVFGNRVTYYGTYTLVGGKMGGEEVGYELGWIGRKLRALACYESQITWAATAAHFLGDQREYYVR